VNLDAAALLVRIVPALTEEERPDVDTLAALAAGTAIGLLHQRDYRFLLRTKAAAFAVLRKPMQRWKIGRGLLPDVARENAAALRVELLGGLRVTIDGSVLPQEAWKRRKARDLFAYLVTMRGRPVPRARLVDLFWPEMEADAAHDSLRVTVSAIRRAVGDVVKSENAAYRFAAPAGTLVDTETFDAWIDTARTAKAEGAIEQARRAYAGAIEIYRGDFMDGFEDGNWQWRDRERLRAAFLEALRWLAHDADGETLARSSAIDRLLETTPFDIDAIRLRLELMAASHQLSEARRTYEDWKARYRAAVGPDPPEVWTAR
jgi:DNA-binding SARP family transcriptional activator